MSASDSLHKKIGELNGPWAVLLRIALATYPLILAWAVWVTQAQFHDDAFRNSGERFTRLDGANLEARMQAQMNQLPPADWKARIIGLETSVGQNAVSLAEVQSKQAEMMRILSRIETRLEKP